MPVGSANRSMLFSEQPFLDRLAVCRELELRYVEYDSSSMSRLTPISPPGEITFRFLLNELDRMGYEGFVGLEYIPSPDTSTSFDWVRGWAFHRNGR